MKISDLKPNKKNPRKITDKRLDMLRQSISKFGDLSGFVFNRRSGTLISGHQRQKTLPADAHIHIIDVFTVPTNANTVAEGYVMVDGERFKYREVDADETWETEAMLAANKHGGEWDNNILKDLLTTTPDINIEFAGFDIPEIQELDIPEPKMEDEKEPEPKEHVETPPQFIVAIECSSEVQMQTLFEEFQSRNLNCKLIT